MTCHMKDTVLPTEKLFRTRIRIALAGMAAEDVVLGNRSVGGSATLGSDLDEATRIATCMIVSYGMGDSPRFENDHRRVTESYRPPPHLRPEIDRILREEWDGAKDILTKHKDRLIFLAEKLVSERKMRISAK